MQYGKQLVAAATYLSVGQFLPEDRLGQLLADLFGVGASTGTIGRTISRATTRASDFAAARNLLATLTRPSPQLIRALDTA